MRAVSCSVAVVLVWAAIGGDWVESVVAGGEGSDVVIFVCCSCGLCGVLFAGLC